MSDTSGAVATTASLEIPTLYFEDLSVGLICVSAGRTVTEDGLISLHSQACPATTTSCTSMRSLPGRPFMAAVLPTACWCCRSFRVYRPARRSCRASARLSSVLRASNAGSRNRRNG